LVIISTTYYYLKNSFHLTVFSNHFPNLFTNLQPNLLNNCWGKSLPLMSKLWLMM